MFKQDHICLFYSSLLKLWPLSHKWDEIIPIINKGYILWMEGILHQLAGSLQIPLSSQYIQYFIVNNRQQLVQDFFHPLKSHL